MTAAEYLVFEEKADIKYEFVDGFVFAMVGAGNTHNIIALNIGAYLRAAIRGTLCRAYLSDMKLQIPKELRKKGDKDYYYPDAFVTCEQDDLDSNIKTTACFVIEILSDGTADTDRGEKLINYRKLTSLQAYVLVSQKKRLIEVYKRAADGWRHDIVEEGEIMLPCVDATLSLDTIYEDVEGV